MRFQYRLRTLFAMVTVAAVGCAWLGHEYRVVQERKAVCDWITHHGGICYDGDNYVGEQSLIRWLGEGQVTLILLGSTTTDADVRRIQAVFPTANSLPVIDWYPKRRDF